MSDSPSGPGERTELQPESSQAKAQELSIPKDVQQHPEAPKLPGYVLISPIGRGTYAQVWKAWQARTRKWVAVKVFVQRTGVDWLFLRREVERLIRLDKHPHIVSLLDADLDAEPPYYVMDYMDGGSLEKHVSPQNPAPVNKAVMWMEEICQALSYVHSKGLIHCDLKPANVLVDEEGHVRLADFGQSRIVTESSGALGTLFYMAPEQAVLPKEGEPLQPDVRWDVYGIGTTMWAILTGRVPHSEYENKLKLDEAGSLDGRLKEYRQMVAARPLQACREATAGRADEDLGAIVDRCVRSEPDLRHAAAQEVGDDLKARQEQRPVSALADRRAYRLKKFLRRHTALVSLTTVAAALIAWTGSGIVRERDSATRKLAFSYVVRAQQFAEKGDDASAAVYYAESNRLAPTRLARANVLAYSADLAVPRLVLNHPETAVRVAFSPDGRAVLTAGWETARVWDAHTGEPLGNAIRHKSMDAAAFGPDGKTVLTQNSHDGAIGLWDARTGKRIAGTEAGVLGAAISPDGKTMLIGSGDNAARLWDARTLKLVGKVMPHDAPVKTVAFSPDGRTVLTLSSATVRLWDAHTGKPIGRAMRHEGLVNAAAFSPDGKTMLTGGDDRTARLWDAHTGRPIGKVMRHERSAKEVPGDSWRAALAALDARAGAVKAVAFSSDGKFVLTQDSYQATRRWDAATGEPIGDVVRYGDEVSAFSPDGKTVLVGKEGKTARLLDARTAEPIGKVMRHESEVRAVAFSPDGKAALTGSDDGTVKLWDVQTAKSLITVMRHRDAVEAVSFSPDGKTVLTKGAAGTAELWDARTGEPIGKSMKHESLVVRSALSPDGKTVFTAGFEGTARLWDVRTGKPMGKAMDGGGIALRAVSFSPDGKVLLMRFYGGAGLWDAHTGEPIGDLVHPERFGMEAAAFSPDGKSVVTGGADSTARLWDAHTGKPIGKPMQHEGVILAVAFSPNGIILVTGSTNGTARLWDAKTCKPLGKAMRHEEQVNDVAFSPDGRAVLTRSGDRTARLWDARTGEPIGRAMRHKSDVSFALFSPDGDAVLTGGRDNTARLWDARTGKPIGKAMRHGSWALAGAFSPDGKAVLTGSQDNTARLWDAKTGEPVGKAMRHDGAVKVIAFRPDGKAVLTGSADTTARLWDVSWLSESTSLNPLLPNAATRRRVTGSGDVEEIPLEDYNKLLKRYHEAARNPKP